MNNLSRDRRWMDDLGGFFAKTRLGRPKTAQRPRSRPTWKKGSERVFVSDSVSVCLIHLVFPFVSDICMFLSDSGIKCWVVSLDGKTEV